MIKILLIDSLRIFTNILETLMLIRLIMSILNVRYVSIISRVIYELTEPILELSRNIIDKIGINTGMFDFSYMLGLFIIRLVYTISISIVMVVLNI